VFCAAYVAAGAALGIDRARRLLRRT
jgi:hypothetical protein